MKRCFVILLSIMMLICATQGAVADDAVRLQVFSFTDRDTSFEADFYLNASDYVDEESFTVRIGEIELKPDKLNSFSKGDYGTTWAVILEPTEYPAISGTVYTMIETLISQFGKNDRMTIYNAVTSERTEYLKSSTTIMPIVEGTMNSKGDSRLYDTVKAVLSEFEKNAEEKGRNCLIIATEGRDHSSKISLSALQREAAELPVTIYNIGLVRNEKVLADAFQQFSTLSPKDATGLSISVNDFKDQKGTGTAIADQICDNERNCYLLTASYELSTVTREGVDSVREADAVELIYKNGNTKWSSTLRTGDTGTVADHLEKVNEKTLHVHTWRNATCTDPKTCTVCGETEGEALGHQWVEATCTDPKTCTVCGETEGEALGHEWVEATCTDPKTCTVCGETEGEALGHQWVEATCTDPKTCTVCGETEGEALGHQWVEATCTDPKSCTVCGETEGEALGHRWAEATCTEPRICTVCGETEANALGHQWIEATCTEPKTCTVCGETEGEALGHQWVEATCTEPKTCTVCGETEGEALGHQWVEATCTEPKTCSVCGVTDGEALGHNWIEATFFEGGVCSRCGDVIPSTWERVLSWAQNNMSLCILAAILFILLIVIVIVSISKKHKTVATVATPSTEPASAPTTSMASPENEKFEKRSKVTVILTNVKTGEQSQGDIFDATIKAGRTAELALSGDATISQTQMEFIWDNGILYVQDANSRNGTVVNGKIIGGAVSLQQSDTIHVGTTDYRVNWHTNS